LRKCCAVTLAKPDTSKRFFWITDDWSYGIGWATLPGCCMAGRVVGSTDWVSFASILKY
jgi:hypothetical protein